MEERVCALKWDEMYIKSYEEYSSKLDEIEGLVDLGPLGRKSERGKCVFVFCLDSLNARHKWRQPIASFLSEKCMKADDICCIFTWEGRLTVAQLYTERTLYSLRASYKERKTWIKDYCVHERERERSPLLWRVLSVHNNKVSYTFPPPRKKKIKH